MPVTPHSDIRAVAIPQVRQILQRGGIFRLCAAQLVQCPTLEAARPQGFRHRQGLIDDFAPRGLVQGGPARVQIVRRAAPRSSTWPGRS